MRTGSPASFLHPCNAMTYAGLMAGIAAIAAGPRGDAAVAGASIALATVADTLDGRVAALFRRSADMRSFGVQLDSLTDAVAFGIAPVVCSASPMAQSEPIAVVWWAAASVYTTCALTRLAFYNLGHGDMTGFIGLPAPVAALLWSTLLLAHPQPSVMAAAFMVIGVGMILPIRIPRPTGTALLMFLAWPAGLLAAHAASAWP